MSIFYVENNLDSGAGSFRQALIDAQNSETINPTIQFSDTYTITLLSGLEIISKPLIINGNGSTIIRTTNSIILFIAFETQNNIEINDLIISSTISIPGANTGINTNTCNLYLTNVTFNGLVYNNPVLSVANYGLCIINNLGTLTMNSCTFDSNIINLNAESNQDTNVSLIYSNESPINADNCNFINNKIIVNGNYQVTNNGFLINTISNISVTNSNIISNRLESTNLSNSSYIHVVNTDECTFQNLTINNNVKESQHGNIVRGIIHVDICTLVNISDCNSSSNVMKNIFYLSRGNLRITSNTGMNFTNNQYGTNIFVVNNGQVIISGDEKIVFDNCTNNTYPSSIYINNCTNVSVNNCEFRNVGDEDKLESMNISNCSDSFIDNLLFENLYSIRSIISIISDNSVRNAKLSNITINSCVTNGLDYGLITIRNINTIHNNINIFNCTNNYYGMIAIFGTSNFIRDGNSITNISECRTSGYGSVYCNTIGIFEISGINISYCSTSLLYIGYMGLTIYPKGGGLSIINNGLNSLSLSNITIENCTCTNDEQSYGGGIYIYSSQIQKPNTITINSTVNVMDNSALIGGNYYFDNIDSVFLSNNVVLESSLFVTTSGTYISSNKSVTLEGMRINSSINSNSLLNVEKIIILNSVINNNELICVNSSIADINYTYFNCINIDENVCTGIEIINGNINGCLLTNYSNAITMNDSVEVQSIILSNSLLTQNKLGLFINSNNTIRCYNNTIANNDNGINSNGNSVLIANTILNNNQNNFVGIAQSQGNNCISDNSGLSIFTQPTDMNNIDAMLNPLADNGGYVQTMSLRFDSPCIDSGNVVHSISSYDNRGNGFNRVINGLIDIGSYEHQGSVVCMKGDTMIDVDIGIDGMIVRKRLDKIVSNEQVLIYNKNGKCIGKRNVLMNVSSICDKLICFQKNELNVNIPYDNIYFTSGHVLVYNDLFIKARDMVTIGYGKKVKMNNTKVYSLIFEKKCMIKSNGIVNCALSLKTYRDIFE